MALLPSRRLAFAVGAVLALTPGTYLTFAPELKTSENMSPSDPALYVPIGLVRVASVLLGRVQGISGIDGIGSRPTDVGFVLWAVVPATVVVALLRMPAAAVMRAGQRWLNDEQQPRSGRGS